MPNARHKSPALHPSEPILTIDQQSAIVAANPAACQALGATEESLMGAPFLARVAGAERPEASRILADGFRGLTGETTLRLHALHHESSPFLVRVIPVIREYDASRLLLLLRDLGVERRMEDGGPRSRSIATDEPRATPPTGGELESFDEVVRAARAGVSARPASLSPKGQANTVLVIDDDGALRGTVRRVLESGGYRVVEATSGRHALTQLREGRVVDLVVTDLKMEDGSGGWLLAQLAYEHPELLPRTVVMAGDAGGVSASHVASRWRCPVLGKPFTRDDLLGALAALVPDEQRRSAKG